VSAQCTNVIDGLLANFWGRTAAGIQQDIATSLTSATKGLSQGSLTVNNLTVLQMDIARSPTIAVDPIQNGQEAVVTVGPWEIQLQGTVTYNLSVSVLGLSIQQPITVPLTVAVGNLVAVVKADMNTTNPTAPTISQIQQPSVTFNLSIQTQQTLAATVLSVLQPAVQAFVQYELQKTISGLMPLLGSLQGQPGAPWGSGGPGFTPFGQTFDLQQAALDASADLQANHTPWGQVYNCTYTSPVYGQGTVTSWDGCGDSAIWTGTYLTGEALRYAATKDPNAIVNAAKVLNGLQLLLDVQDPNSGRLSRFAVPLSTPFGQSMLPIGGTEWIATLNGVQYVCDENISRDQHDGFMMGCSAVYSWIDDPTLRDQAGTLIDRVVDFLNSTGWNALMRNGQVSAPFWQSPADIVAFTAAAEDTNPRRYELMRDELGQVAAFDWIGTFISTLDPINGYFKWNLGHESDFIASFQIMRNCVGFHRNPWFNGVAAALDASTRPTWGPIVADDMYRLVSRGRRDYSVTNSTNPAIQKGTYSAGLQVPGGTSLFGISIPLGTAPETVAQYPVPVDMRPVSDFEWQRCPFDLDGSGDPHHEEAGVDFVVPYWTGRYYGFLK
jgi:hypothetical protein